MMGRVVMNIPLIGTVKFYAVVTCVTVDEQLIPFRDRCSFRAYMRNKSDNYGLKQFLCCDYLAKYTLNGMPYIGRQKKEARWVVI